MATNNEIEFKQILTKDLYDKITTLILKMKNHLAKLIIILIL